MRLTRDELVARLIKAGELEVMGGDQVETDSDFDTERFRFHGPASFEANYGGLTNYFKSIRGAFDDRSIRRGVIVVEGKYVACQTWIEGQFVREFTQSPAGSLPPNGERVVWISRTSFGSMMRSSRRGVGTDRLPELPSPAWSGGAVGATDRTGRRASDSHLGIEHMAYKATYRSALDASWWVNGALKHIPLLPVNKTVPPFRVHRSVSLRARMRQPLESASEADQFGFASILGLG
jgi:hypothetical protein